MPTHLGLLAIRFIHADWCDLSCWKTAWLCLVVDPELSLHSLTDAKSTGLLFLVPSVSLELTNYVREYGSGLTYATTDALLGSLHHLVNVQNEIRTA